MADDFMLRRLIDTWYDDWFAVDRLYSEWAKEHGITYTVLFTLYVIHANEENFTPGQISSKLALSKQTISSALDLLESKGIILREIDKTDKRNRIIRFTQTGREYAQEILGELDAAERQAFKEFSPDTIHDMIAFNRQLTHSLQKVLTLK